MLLYFRYFGYFYAEVVEDVAENADERRKVVVDGFTDAESQQYLFDEAREEIELILSPKELELFTRKFTDNRKTAIELCIKVLGVLNQHLAPIPFYLKCLQSRG